MGYLQRLVTAARRPLPRGWSPLLGAAAHVLPHLRRYRARLADGDHLYVDLRETMCMPYFFFGGLPHESGTNALLNRVLTEGAVFVDVGANVGYFTRLASRLVGPTGRVHAFEPMPRAFGLLQRNTADLANTRIYPMAVGEQSGETTFYVRKAGDLSSLDPDRRARVVRVPLTTLDKSLAKLRRIDLIKIDVEGFEPEVLRGARAILARHHPVVHFEYLTEYAEKRGFDIAAVTRFLDGLGYRLRWIDHAARDGGFMSDQPSTYALALPPEPAGALAA